MAANSASEQASFYIKKKLMERINFAWALFITATDRGYKHFFYEASCFPGKRTKLNSSYTTDLVGLVVKF